LLSARVLRIVFWGDFLFFSKTRKKSSAMAFRLVRDGFLLAITFAENKKDAEPNYWIQRHVGGGE